MNASSELPVAVIGAGPQGLAAAAHLLRRGLEPVVIEAGAGPGAAIAEWGHVHTFSPWPELIDGVAAALLAPTGWTAPTSGYPSGREWVANYLAPLADILGERVRYRVRVTGVSRQGHDRVLTPGRHEAPFVVHLTGADGAESRLCARAVIDASGTWGQPNPIGSDGISAVGEHLAAAAGLVTYVPPSPEQAASWAGSHVVVVGSGHSAMTAIIGLAETVHQERRTRVTWALRRGGVGDAFGGPADTALPQRGALCTRVREAAEDGLLTVVSGFRTERIEVDGARAVLVAEDGRALPAADAIVGLTGFRPDLSFLSELRLALDPVLQAPLKLAAQIDPNVHTCSSVPPHGVVELSHPDEPDIYVVGMKSYGRAPTFLALTGYEQVRSVTAELAGDYEAARRVELVVAGTSLHP
ncbi:flavoprotein [Mycobacterium sp. 852013-50091_SCH5140682]|uniref:NAD(P)-binding domain-containing protein n=1 Tax=Mycobacterium sp. 852013-50091_SCH5140682 TaxID=1834109 RepID=UPI0007EA2E41|nr:NAD(P)-binding domain-containing protein [Mycobacterium sp. 852013-50091_SCH5140682]OBC08194.1 flavoprotein [Mycobacterium sp. 852013-50091_SCH5140682]